MGGFRAYIRGVALFVAGIFVGAIMMRPGAAQQNRSAGLRLNHVGIAVKDFQESLNFYTKVMGFRVAYAFPSPDGKPTTTFLQINRDTFIEMAPASAESPSRYHAHWHLVRRGGRHRHAASAGRRNCDRRSSQCSIRLAAGKRWRSQRNQIRGE